MSGSLRVYHKLFIAKNVEFLAVINLSGKIGAFNNICFNTKSFYATPKIVTLRFKYFCEMFNVKREYYALTTIRQSRIIYLQKYYLIICFYHCFTCNMFLRFISKNYRYNIFRNYFRHRFLEGLFLMCHKSLSNMHVLK